MKKMVFSLFTIALVCCTAMGQKQGTSKPAKIDGSLTVAVDLVSANTGCSTLNVRVYKTNQGERLLVANSNVLVGACQKKSGKNENPTCKDQEFKGDYFFYTKDQFKYCLVELLQDEVTYAKYIIAKNKVIDSIKK